MKIVKPASHLRIPYDLMRSVHFGKFMLTKESAVWFNLCAWIVRGQMGSCGLGKKLYEDYYLGKKKLVAHWDQDKIAEHIGLSPTSRGYISRMLTRLEQEWNAIVRIPMKSNHGNTIYIYEMGCVWKDREIIYLFKELWARELDDRILRLNGGDDGRNDGGGFQYGNQLVSV